MLNLPHEMIYGPMMTSFHFISYYFLFLAGNVYYCNAYTKRLFETFLQRTVKLFERRRKICPDFSFSIFFFLHCFHLLFFVIKFYKVTLITSYNRQTPSDQNVYTGACVSYSECLQSKIVYVMFSCKNSLIRGKLHTLYLSTKKDVKRKRDPRLWFFSQEKCFNG